jgi:hypothetical protein
MLAHSLIVLNKSKGDFQMNTKKPFLISVSFIIILLLIGGCATSHRIKEPSTDSSTLLVGRITFNCSGFPQQWHVNGQHKDGVTIYLWNFAKEEYITIRSHGADGLFYLIDPEPVDGRYVLVGFGLQSGSSRMTINLGYEIEDEPYVFILTKNAVNNLGDVRWDERYQAEVSKEYDRKGSQTTMEAEGSHKFENNFNEVESWFKTTYPESDWSRKNWVNVTRLKK